MRYKIFIHVLAIVILASAHVAEAQPPGKVHRIGLLISASNVIAPFTDAFRQGLRELGYVEGKNYVLEIRGGKAKRDQYAAELVRLKVDIIVTVGFPALRAASKATSTIPIVMRTGGDPVKRGLVASLAHPGGNLTGRIAMSVELSAKRLELFKETVPGAKRIAVLTTSRRIAAREGRLYKECIKALAISSRLFIPPDNCLTCVSLFCPRLNWSSNSSTLFLASWRRIPKYPA